jgi:hypothetical protein
MDNLSMQSTFAIECGFHFRTLASREGKVTFKRSSTAHRYVVVNAGDPQQLEGPAGIGLMHIDG